MNVDKKPQKKQQIKREGSKRNKIISSCIGAAIFIGLIVLVAFDYLYVAPCIKVDGKSYNINDILVRYNVYNYEAQLQMDAIYAQMTGSVTDVNEYWNDDNVKNTAKENAKNNAIKTLLMHKEAVKAGVSLTDEEKETEKKDAKTFYSAMSADHKKRANFSLDELTEYKLMFKLANKYIDQLKKGYNITNDKLETPIKEEDYDEIKFKLIVAPITNAQSSSDKAEKFDDKTLATYMAKMKEYLAQAKSGKDMSEIVAEEDSAIYQYMETTLLRDNETYQKVLDALEPLKNGELCDYVIEDDKAYYIVQMVDDQCKDSYNNAVTSAISSKENELLSNEVSKLMKEYNVEFGSGWDDIEIGNVVVYPGEEISEFTASSAENEEEGADASASPDASATPAASTSPKASTSPDAAK